MLRYLRLLVCLFAVLSESSIHAATPDLFAKENLLAWCIVPYDAKKRGPEERAEMLERLGIKRLAYDYRAEHIPTFDAEMEALKRNGIELTAWWFPGALNEEARGIFRVIERHGVHPQLWVTGGGAPTRSSEEQAQRVEEEAARIRPIAEAAAKLGLKVGLYNHGGWFGQPENQIAVIRKLGMSNVGIVYNFHHGHEHLDRFAAHWMLMQPHLIAVNLNGMALPGTPGAQKIMRLGTGTEELRMLRVIRDSGWQGPVGILNHREEMDAEVALGGNLEGLEKLRGQLADDFHTIPAAKTEALTPANGWPAMDSYRTWERSLGGPTSNRFSALNQIHRGNVAKLEVAWTYRSGEAGNIQCNPIVADGVMYTPVGGGHIVAVDAATGEERWRFTPEHEGRRLEDAPARRGLLLWRGDHEAPARLLFAAGYWIYALDPKTGEPIASFGEGGRTRLPAGGTAGGAVWGRVFIVPGYHRDVFGYDVVTGRELWRFHTIPHAGEYGAETWENPDEGANCWGGMALDEKRGIAYVSTGSPKPNFIGPDHLGANLFSNCVIALKAATGERLWHFQEIRHDVWDLDIPASPNLVTVQRDGKAVDAVAQVTKIGNTLLLDRVTGEPLFPFRLRRAPSAILPGERMEPFQPDVELPEPFARQLFTRDQITTRTPEAHAAVEQLLARATFGWFAPFEESRPNVFYGLHGGAEWTGSSFDPTSGRLYVSANTIPWMITVFRDDDPPPAKPQTEGEKTYFLYCAPCHGQDRVRHRHGTALARTAPPDERGAGA
jgi:outer membrane protein assembly factor BamB/sugar phosphate isomerase/epimerase